MRPPPRKAAPEVQNFLHLLVQHRGPRATLTHLPRSCSQRLLECPDRTSLLRPGGLQRAPCHRAAGAGVGYRRLSDGREISPSGDWVSGNSTFTVSRGSPGTPPRTPGRGCRFSAMLFSHISFRIPVRHQIPEISPLIPARCAGNTAVRLMAHPGSSAWTSWRSIPGCGAARRPGRAGNSSPRPCTRLRRSSRCRSRRGSGAGTGATVCRVPGSGRTRS